MKIEPVESYNKDRITSTLLSNEFVPPPEFERLLEWVGLGASNVRKSLACIEEYQQSLRALGETEQRLSELDQWRESPAFNKREKSALSLSETISLHDAEEVSILILKEARCHFSTHQIVRLVLAVIAVNDWIDLH